MTRHVEGYWYVSEGPKDDQLESIEEYLAQPVHVEGLGIIRVIRENIQSLMFLLFPAVGRIRDRTLDRAPTNQESTPTDNRGSL